MNERTWGTQHHQPAMRFCSFHLLALRRPGHRLTSPSSTGVIDAPPGGLSQRALAQPRPLAPNSGLKPTTQRFEITIDSNGGLYETLGKWTGKAFDG